MVEPLARNTDQIQHAAAYLRGTTRRIIGSRFGGRVLDPESRERPADSDR
jgi:hypothetical protein